METEDLKILLALEPSWTVSINGREFLSLSADAIELQDSTLRFQQFIRKVEQVQWLRPNVVRIHARSKWKRQVDVLTFYPENSLSFGAELQRRRRTFQRAIARAAAEYFQVRTIDRQTLHSDKQHGIGGAYPRFLSGSKAMIAVDPDESNPVINGIMRAALQWSTLIRQRIAVVVPKGRTQTIATRLGSAPAIRSRFDWLEWDGEQITKMKIDQTPHETYVQEYREPDVLDRVARIVALAPDLLQPVPHIPGQAISIRFRGLEVARVGESGTVFPMGEPLEPLIEKLGKERRHGSRHPLARAHEESWLESNLIRQIRDVAPVQARCIYPQVPSFTGEDRRIIDLLTITDSGRLVIVEVKAAADPELPLQAFDYWLAVERHRKAGDFKAKGYFPGLEIRDEPALLVIVAPLLAFHRSLDGLLAILPRSLPVMQIGINQSWKREIKILRRRGSLG